jgi:glycosyltransferase involved in cell wall biosynthesis
LRIPPRNEHFTFAVVGHNEAASLRYSLEQALAAALPGEEVWFVDSGSTDDSLEVAASVTPHVLEAPLGKGRAIATVLERCTSGYLCLLDADLTASEANIPVALREAAAGCAIDMLVGEFDWPERRRSVVPGIYVPLVGKLFPEVLQQVPYRPTSGFRVLNAELDLGTLPAGYGVETRLNVVLTMAGATIATVPIGRIAGPVPSLDHKPSIIRRKNAAGPEWLLGRLSDRHLNPRETAQMAATDVTRTRDGAHDNSQGGVRRLVTETKEAIKTTEFYAYAVVLAGILIAGLATKAGNGHDDRFLSKHVWLYATILTVGYMISRGLAKSGSHQPYDDDSR